MSFRLRSSILALTCVACLNMPLQAQYFGQNKVRYHSYEFKVLKTKHFDIYYYPQEKTAAEQAGRLAERWEERLSKVFQRQLAGRQPVILYGSHPAFEQTTVTPEIIGVGTGGFTEPLRRRVVMPLAGPLGESSHVLGHELVHAFQFDIMQPRGAFAADFTPNLPLWFIEGMAEYLSLGPADPLTTMWVRDAVRRSEVPAIKDLDNPKYFPYRWGQAFWAYVGGRYGDQAIGRMMQVAAKGGVQTAIKQVLDTSTKQLSRDWQQALTSSQRPVLQATTPLADSGRSLLPVREPGDLNVSPVISPDGKHLMFFSARQLFSVELFLANAENGHVIRKITKTAVSPHFDNLEFINSAGAWNSDGSQFAFGHVSGPHAEISIYDLKKDEIVRRVKVPDVAEVFSPTWSPDGKRIAFSAMAGGLTNLYLLDLATGQVSQLTNDQFAELEPAWSPDGNTIAFVTDRFSSDLQDLAFGNFRLGLLDLASGNMREVPTFKEGKNIDPNWSADGKTLFFVSDQDGISNVYRISLADQKISQITNLQTGVSGITHLSPALSVASQAGRIVFSAFQDSGYSILRLDGESELAGGPLNTKVSALNAGILPPRQTAAGEVASLLRSPQVGLVSSRNFETKPYSPSLSLDYIAPPQVAAGFSSFGALVAGAPPSTSATYSAFMT